MGIWGAGPLDNDEAMDFVDGLLDLSPQDAMERLLEAVGVAAETTSPLDYMQGVRALAAAAVLTRVSLPERLGTWRATLPVTPAPAFTEVLREAIERTLSEDSELAALWTEAGKGREFAGGVASLIEAVMAAGVDPRQPTLF